MNARYLHRVAVIGGILAVAATASLIHVGSAPAAQGSNCPANPKRAPAYEIPVWVYLDVFTKTGAPEPGVGFNLRVYSLKGGYSVHGDAWSGCVRLVLFMRGKVPSSICIKARDPYREPDGSCQAIGVAPDGQRVVHFKLTRQ